MDEGVLTSFSKYLGDHFRSNSKSCTQVVYVYYYNIDKKKFKLWRKCLEEIEKRAVTPGELGFDSTKFPEYRNGQYEAALRASATDKKLFLVEAPTGVGKSLLGLTSHALLERPRAAYLVSTKQLQDQLVSDFNLPVLKGRNNYPCLHFKALFPDVTSEICREYLGDRKCDFEADCPYLVQKREALMAPICILNYPLFLTEANYVGGFSGLKYLVLDEIDTVEDHLMSFIEVPITQGLMKRLKTGIPEFKTKVDAWRGWAKKVKDKITDEISNVEPRGEADVRSLRELIRLRRTLRRIDFLIENLDESWVMELEDIDSASTVPVTFKPVKVDSYASNFLWDHTEKALGMSATVMGAASMAVDLGLHSWDVDSVSLDSPFPVESRKIEYIPIASVTHKTKEQAYPKLNWAVEAVLRKHPNDKVLLHSVSYDLRNYFVQHLSLRYHRMFTHDSKDRAEVLGKFKGYNGPAVLVSPSMGRGVDLPGDLCRVIIVAKVPYPNLVSPQVNKRLHSFSDGSLWYARRTARTLVQMTGRATRSVDDWSVSYILDSQFGELVARSGNLFPSWWRLAVKSGNL